MWSFAVCLLWLIFGVAHSSSSYVVVDPNTTASGVTAELLPDPNGRNMVYENQWRLNQSLPIFLSWGLHIALSADVYGFREGTNDSFVSVSIQGEKVSTDCDITVAIGIGSTNYVTYSTGLDTDGYLHAVGEPSGSWIWPSCGGMLASGDVATVFDTYSNHTWRDAVSGGSATTAELLTDSINGNNWPLVWSLTSNDIDKTLTIAWSSPTYTTPLSCVFSTANASVTEQDINIFMMTIDTDPEVVDIGSVAVNRSNVGLS